MTAERFEQVVKQQLNKCLTTLNIKNNEYTGGKKDRFHSFIVAAELQNCDKKQALAGMMAKHSVSIYDMCQGGEYPLNQWEEKITDSINYLLLLKGIVMEDRDE